jgi:hypothetical protein
LVNPVDTIGKGDSALFTIQAVITDPSADLELGIFQPLGYHVSLNDFMQKYGVNTRILNFPIIFC